MVSCDGLYFAALALGTLGGDMAQIGLGSVRVMSLLASADPVTNMCGFAFYFAKQFDYVNEP